MAGAKQIQARSGYLTVNQTARLLGVSIDTLRRWDKSGRLVAERLDGRNRYFSIDEIEAFRAGLGLSTKQVASRLGISVSSVRRLEEQGLLKSNRDSQGWRWYDRSSVETYIKSTAIPGQAGTEPARSQAHHAARDFTTLRQPAQAESNPPTVRQHSNLTAVPSARSDQQEAAKPAKAAKEPVTITLPGLPWWVILSIILAGLLIGLVVWVAGLTHQPQGPGGTQGGQQTSPAEGSESSSQRGLNLDYTSN